MSSNYFKIFLCLFFIAACGGPNDIDPHYLVRRNTLAPNLNPGIQGTQDLKVALRFHLHQEMHMDAEEWMIEDLTLTVNGEPVDLGDCTPELIEEATEPFNLHFELHCESSEPTAELSFHLLQPENAPTEDWSIEEVALMVDGNEFSTAALEDCDLHAHLEAEDPIDLDVELTCERSVEN